MKSLHFSKTLATVFGVVLILLETLRRRTQLFDPHYFLNWFDDYLIGGFLLFAAWKASKNLLDGQRYLAGAWGAVIGGLFWSFFGQLQRLHQPEPTSIMSPVGVVIIKGVLFTLAIVGLCASLRKPAL